MQLHLLPLGIQSGDGLLMVNTTNSNQILCLNLQ